MRRKIVLFLVILLGLYLVFTLGRQVYFLFRAKGRIAASEQKLSQVQAEQEKFKKELEYRNSEAFIEEEARNRLGLAKEGETVVVLPEKLQAKDQEAPNTTDQKTSNILRWFERLFL